MSLTKKRILPKRGYILLLAGTMIGFLIFSAISLIFTEFKSEEVIEGFPSRIEFEFLYTSEKQGWIESITPKFEDWFFKEFSIHVKVKLTVTGTHDSVNRILDGSIKPTAWSPASSIWIPYLNTKWRSLGNDYDIALSWYPLVISPTVLGVWESFKESYNITCFKDIYNLIKSGKDLKYGHPDPLLSNGGVTILLLEFAEAAGKMPKELTIEDFKNETVIEFVKTIESKSVYYGKSTGFFGAWAVESGPSAITIFGVYENVVLENSKKALVKWNDRISAVYPKYGTILNDHPFVILNAPWVKNWEKFAATQYLFFLMNEENQIIAQKHGFRPANPVVKLDKSIFNPDNGISYELKVPILEPPPGEVLEALFTVWNKVRNPGI